VDSVGFKAWGLLSPTFLQRRTGSSAEVMVVVTRSALDEVMA
jgi:hypothetical protein